MSDNSNKEIEAFKSRFIYSLSHCCEVNTDDRILVAVSGGADSVALLHLLINNGFHCVVAHCNFSLRGAESDEDEVYVRQICNDYNVECRIKKFDTIGYASEKKISIEMAARDLRYNWFNELLQQLGLNRIATGHHGNDDLETFFLNLVRGTGIKGLTGISSKRGALIRPLLFAQSSEIVSYCNANGLAFRTDSTNADTKIIRNKIRHDIIPLFTEINPAFFQTMQTNLELLKEVSEVFAIEVNRFKEQVVVSEDENVLIPVSLVKDHPQRKSLLFEVLRPYGFNGAVIDEVVKGLDGIPGRQYFSETHRLVRDRYNLILVKKEFGSNDVFYIQANEPITHEPIQLNIRVFDRTSDFKFSSCPDIAHFDADLIDFPLEIRRWKNGDQFQPLGMDQFKKLSDFFVNEKYSLIDKERVWLLISNNDIIWVIGKRMDNRFKVTAKTKRVLEISC